MHITVESAYEGKNLPEWGLMEFQGWFSSNNKIIFGEFLGDLNYSNNGAPFFIIGHHILYGQEVQLPRPFFLVKKSLDNGELKYLVVASVRRKVVFKTRPKPIICREVYKKND